jgi:ribonuclease D
VLQALQRWRDDAARRNGVLPVQLMSDRDIVSIAAARPTTPEELLAASSVGPITARRLAPELAAVIERAAAQPMADDAGADGVDGAVGPAVGPSAGQLDDDG